MTLHTGECLVTALVHAVAEAEGVEATELDVVIQSHIDIEAVSELAAHESATWTLSFELPDHDVTVTSDGSILVDGIHRNDWSVI